MKLGYTLCLLAPFLFSSTALADDGCRFEHFEKLPFYDQNGNVQFTRHWLQVKLKTPYRKETHLFVQPDPDGTYDIYLSGDKLVKYAVTPQEAVPILQGICPDLFAFPTPKPTPQAVEPRASGVPRIFGQMSGNVAQTDLNGDGVVDSISLASSRVNIVFKNADQTIQSTRSYPAVPNAVVVIAADLNGDGKPDLAVGGDSNNKDGSWLAILMNNGDGTFTGPNLMAVGNGVVRIAAADFNADGKVDLVVANPYSNQISMLLGNGDGTFRTRVAYTAPAYPSAMVVTDLNHDGRPDVAVLARFGDQLGVFLSNGDGTLKPALTQSAGHADHALAFADLNNDGQMDLVGVDFFGSALSVLLGKGDGTFSMGGRYLGATQPESISVLPALDGSSVLFSVDGNTGNIVMILANPDGSLSTPVPLDGGSQLTAVAAGDVNGDGKPDIVSTDSTGNSVIVTLNTGGGNLAASKVTKLTGTGSSGPSDIKIADLNGDGRGDLILALASSGSSVSGIGVLLSGPDGTPGPMQRYLVGVEPVALVTGDFNGDGKLDVAVACMGESDPAGNNGVAGVLLGKGDGTFLASLNLPQVAGQRPVSVAAADFDGDGKLDLAVASKPVSFIGPGKITLYLGKGDGTFSAGRDVPFADPTNYPEKVLAADLNGDGKMDLVALLYVQNPVWVVAGFLNRGGGAFTAAPITATDFGPIAAVAKDFDGDGKVDLVVAHCCGLTAATYLTGNGDGTFQPEIDLMSVPSPVSVATADFDGDGRPDLVSGGNRDRSQGGVVAIMGGDFPAPAAFVVLSAADPKVTNIASDSIASAFGNGLALRTETSASAAWPTTLGGTSVQIRDSAGVSRAALLSYASATQLNFAVPPGVANGAATVTIQPQGGSAVTASMNVTTVAPAVFTLNASGLAAALVFRVKADQTQTVEQIYQVDSAGQVVAKPIDLGSAADQVYLLLFGTGIRQGSGAKVTIGGVDAPVSYAGPQGQYSGFDQVNALVPRSLAGKGSVTVRLTVSGVSSGDTAITIQ